MRNDQPQAGPAAEPAAAAALSDAQADALIARLGAAARSAAQLLARTPTARKASAVRAMAAAIRAGSAAIGAANARDMAAAAALSPAMRDRLLLTPERIEAIAAALDAVAALPDPVGEVIARWERPNGLRFERVRVPLGVVGIVYESRPNVTADAGALALMAGNAAVLRGGSEAVHSNRALADALAQGLAAAGLPQAAIQLVPTQDRAAVGAMLRASGLIDILVPRGGKPLVARVQAEARVPVLAHLDGICHVYVHAAADPAKARAIALNAKMRRTGICGAMETLLIDRAFPDPRPILAALLDAGCELRVTPDLLPLDPRLRPVAPEDWGREYLAPVLSVGTVDGVEAAAAHIATHGSAHTDAIVTEDAAAAEAFLALVDSAIVLWNASTQFADGGEFGFGAEIGIATGRLHARGPVALEGLTTYKTVVRGTGQIRP